jgi:hypothetical protein
VAKLAVLITPTPLATPSRTRALPPLSSWLLASSQLSSSDQLFSSPLLSSCADF